MQAETPPIRFHDFRVNDSSAPDSLRCHLLLSQRGQVSLNRPGRLGGIHCHSKPKKRVKMAKKALFEHFEQRQKLGFPAV